MSRSKLDATHIAQLTFDENSESVKVKLQDTEIAMELNHADGDSVTAHPAKLTVSVLGIESSDNGTDIVPAQDCSSLHQVRVDIEGSGSIEILASPNDSGSFFYSVGGAGVIHNICASRIKVKSVDVIGSIHLVGKA